MARRIDERQMSLLDLLAVPAFRTEPVIDTGPVRAGFTAMDEAVIAAFLGNRYALMMGYALKDVSVPYLPRSISFPVTLQRDRDGTPHLYVASPVYADLPYVRRVGEVTGLKAISHPMAHGAFWHHAFDLATNTGWKRLAESMQFTTLDRVDRVVSLKVIDGELSPANARSLLERLGVSEPYDRSAAALAKIDVNFGNMGLDGTGWTAVHAVEDGWVAPGRERKGRTIYASITPNALAVIASRQDQAA